MNFFKCLFLIVLANSLLKVNPLFAQKKTPKSIHGPQTKVPKKITPQPVQINFGCMFDSVSEVIVDGQKIYLKKGLFLAKLKLIDMSEPNFGLGYAFKSPFKDTIFIRSLFQHFITEIKTNLTFAVSEKYYLQYSSLKKKPLTIPLNEKLYSLQKGKEFKAIMYHLVDFDTIVSGGRGSFTGIYPLEITEVNKPFISSILTNRDSAKSNKTNYVCFNDPDLLGYFIDSATSDTIRVSLSSQKPGLRILFKAKGSKNFMAIQPKFHFYPLNTVIGTNQSIPYSKTIPFSTANNFFYFSGNCWILPGQSATIDDFPDGKIPEGVNPTPFIPAKFFRKIIH